MAPFYLITSYTTLFIKLYKICLHIKHLLINVSRKYVSKKILVDT